MPAGSSRALAVIALLALAAPATAQPSSQAAAATAQFDKGRALMKQDKLAEACAAFEQSQKLDAQFGTLYNLAGCYQALGKLASAWAAYRELAQRDTNPGRKKDAGKKAHALDKRLPRLVIKAAEPPAGLVVTLDGVDVTGLVGTDSPIDLGDHKLHATAPGLRDFDTVVAITVEGKTVAAEVALAPASDRAEATVAARAPAVAPRVEPAAPRDDAPPSSRRVIGVAIAAGGVALLATGLVFGRLADSKWSDAKQLCGTDLMCDSPGDLAAGNQLVADARSRATISTVLTIAGGAAVATGIVVFVTAPSRSASSATAVRIAPVATPDSVSLVLGGGF